VTVRTERGSRGALARRRLVRLVAAALVVGAAGCGPAGAEPNAPAARFVDGLGQKVLAVLRDGRLDRAARLERLSRLIDEATDLALVARLVLGRYWREASEAQRRDFVALFRALILKTMAERLDEYGGETYEIVGVQPVDERDSIVSTRILRQGGTPIAVDWRVRAEGGRLLLIDIVAEGVSLVVTQRSEMAEIAGRSGIDGLLAEMRRRLDRSA
jgi:phospholipid transport system substrate-binding protein